MFYRPIVVPLIAFLPAPLAYGVALLWGDVRHRFEKSLRRKIAYGLASVLGDRLSPRERTLAVRDYFRLRSCEPVDLTRLAGKGQALAQLVEIHGLNHIETALASGNGAILCGAHFGSYYSCFSLLGARGFPITVMARWQYNTHRGRSPVNRLVYPRNRIPHHLRRRNIEVRRRLSFSAAQASIVLRHDELLFIALDAPASYKDHTAIQMDFLNRRVWLFPGAITLAQVTGAPVLMTLIYRSSDWRHQVLEISPPIQVEGDTAKALERCLAVVEEAIRRHPAHWRHWESDRWSDRKN